MEKRGGEVARKEEKEEMRQDEEQTGASPQEFLELRMPESTASFPTKYLLKFIRIFVYFCIIKSFKK